MKCINFEGCFVNFDQLLSPRYNLVAHVVLSPDFGKMIILIRINHFSKRKWSWLYCNSWVRPIEVQLGQG